MALEPVISQMTADVLADVEAQTIATLLNGGWLRFFDVSGNILASCRFADNAFNGPVNGLITSNPIVPDTNTAGDAEAVRFEAQTANGDMVFGGSAGIGAGFNYSFTVSNRVRPGGEVHPSVITYQAGSRVVTPQSTP